MKTVKIATKVTITIKRPNGKVEKVSNPNVKNMNNKTFEIAKKATFKANGSTMISYHVDYEYKKVMSKSEMLAASEDQTVNNMSRMGE